VTDLAYKIELHCHTFPVSGCSNLRGAELVRLYSEAGYSALHITDHFTSGFFREQDFTDYFYGYHAAVREGEKRGIKVYLGAEFRFDGSNNDYLLFGVTKDFLFGAKDMFGSTHKEFHEYCSKNGVLLYQAHPFRDGMTRTAPEHLDGIEGYNMHPYHHSRNELSLQFAAENGLPIVSGSDAHEKHMVGRGGIVSETLPEDSKGLRDLVLSGKFELYHEGECV